MTSTRRLALGLAAVALALSGCGGDDTAEAPAEADVPAYDTAQEAYAAVVQAYADGECDVAAALVDGTAEGVEQFVSGCEKRENLAVIETLEAQEETTESSLELPPGASEAVRLTAAFTDESGQQTDYYPDLVRFDDGWKLWLPGDVAPPESPSVSPAP